MSDYAKVDDFCSYVIAHWICWTAPLLWTLTILDIETGWFALEQGFETSPFAMLIYVVKNVPNATIYLCFELVTLVGPVSLTGCVAILLDDWFTAPIEAKVFVSFCDAFSMLDCGSALNCLTFSYSLSLLSCRIPAVGFPALAPGHHVPIPPACNAPVNNGGSSTRNNGKERTRKRGSKRSRK